MYFADETLTGEADELEEQGMLGALRWATGEEPVPFKVGNTEGKPSQRTPRGSSRSGKVAK